MKNLLFIMLFLLCTSTYAQGEHLCEQNAIEQAGKLLKFHFGEDHNLSISVDDTAKVMHPIKNPKNNKQSFDVLEVWAAIYKGEYRMRFIYAQMDDSCVLMGQEILEYANL